MPCPPASTSNIQLKDLGGGIYRSYAATVPSGDIFPTRTLTYGDAYIVAEGNTKFFRRSVVGQSYQKDLLIHNVGFVTGTVDITTPTNFTLTPSQSLPATLAPGETLTVTVDFVPTGPMGSLVSEELDVTVVGGRSTKVLLGATVVSGSPSTVNITSNPVSTYALDQENTNYVLQTDVDVTGAAFSVTADNVTLDTNGYTVTYGMPTNPRIPGIMCMPNFRADALTGLVGLGGGSSHGFEVKGAGTITQRVGSGELGHCIYNYSHTGEFHTYSGVTLEPKENAAQAIRVEYGDKGGVIDGVTANSSVLTINSRHQLEGYIIELENTPSFWTMRNSNLSGGCQGGIVMVDVDYSQTHENVISHQARNTNGFGIILGKYSDGWLNTIPAAASGRGLRLEDYSFMWNNDVDMQERYETPDSGYIDAYALQVEKESGLVGIGMKAFSNSLVARAYDLGDGTETIKMTSLPPSNDVAIHNNYVAAYRSAVSSKAAHCVANIQVHENPGGSAALIDNDYLVEEKLFRSYWDGSSGLYIKGGTVTLGGNAETTVGTGEKELGLARMIHGIGDGFASTDNKILDLTLPPELSMGDTYLGDNPSQDAQLGSGWSYNLTVTSDGVTPVSSATVVIDDAAATEVFNSTTDAAGEIEADLLEWEWIALASAAASKNDRSLHEVTVSKSGYVTQVFTVDMTEKRTETITLVAT